MRIDVRDAERRVVGRIEVDPARRPTRVRVEGTEREVFLDWDTALDDAHRLRRCVVCGCNDLFRTKVFPQVTGLVVALAFTGAAIGALGLANPTILIVMIAVLVADVSILLFAKQRLVCHRCRSRYHDLSIARYHRRWDRAVAERHAQPAAPSRFLVPRERWRWWPRHVRARRAARQPGKNGVMSEPRTLVLLGGGGHAAVVAEAARAGGWTLRGYLDDDSDDRQAAMVGLVRLGGIGDLTDVLARAGPATVGHAAVGAAALRLRWLDALGDRSAGPITHPAATVSPSATLAEGVFVGPGAVVNARASVGRGVIVNSGAIVEHDCVLGAFCHVAPGAVLGGGAVIGPAALVGINAAVLPGVRIGAGATLGAGSVAVSEVPDLATATGVPAAEQAVVGPASQDAV